MKRLLFLLTILLLSGTVQSFGQSKASSNSEKFIQEPGRILEKEMVTLGEVPVRYNNTRRSMNINTLNFKDLMSGEKKSCLVFELIKKTKYAYIDPDEIAGMTNMFKLMQEQFLESTKHNYTELVYNTRGGTEIGCFNTPDGWVIFIILDKTDKNNVIEVNSDELPQMLEFIGIADTNINSANTKSTTY